MASKEPLSPLQPTPVHKHGQQGLCYPIQQASQHKCRWSLYHPTTLSLYYPITQTPTHEHGWQRSLYHHTTQTPTHKHGHQVAFVISSNKHLLTSITSNPTRTSTLARPKGCLCHPIQQVCQHKHGQQGAFIIPHKTTNTYTQV